MQRDKAVQNIGKFSTAVGFATAEPHAHAVVGQRQMIVRSRKKRPERPPIVADSAYRNARERRAVIALLPSQQPKPLTVPDLLEPGPRQFERRIDRLRTGIDEENVVKPWRSQFREPCRQLERRRMAKLESGRIIEHARGRPDCLHDGLASVTCVDTP
jgi:hypothetical protein